jgi:signal transduction histidine kinase
VTFALPAGVSYWPKSQCGFDASQLRLVIMELDESLASDTNTSRRTELAHTRARGELERAAPPVVAGELVAAITHDLRQPLTAIEMNVSAAIALLGRAAPRVDEAIDALQDALEQERRMRDSLQVLQNLAIRREPQREAFDLAAMVHEVVGLVNTDALARHVSIELDVAAALPPISGDVMLVRQALLNIVLYALEATSLGRTTPGSVRVSVRAAAKRGKSTPNVAAHPADAVEVAVTHFGERGETANVDHWGLALARSVANAHGATIAFESEAAAGVVVVTRWPMRPPEVAPLPSLTDA